MARLTPAEEHAYAAAGFSAAVDAVTDWSAPTPVAAWTARDVVGHLIEWLPGFLSNGAGVELLPVSVEDDPAAAWQVRTAEVQALLDMPGDRIYRSDFLGEKPLAAAIDQFYTADVFMHTWDLARAAGVDPDLDEGRCEEFLGGLRQMGDALRVGDQFGPEIEVPAGASAQDRLIGFIGRDPNWHAPGDS